MSSNRKERRSVRKSPKTSSPPSPEQQAEMQFQAYMQQKAQRLQQLIAARELCEEALRGSRTMLADKSSTLYAYRDTLDKTIANMTLDVLGPVLAGLNPDGGHQDDRDA